MKKLREQTGFEQFNHRNTSPREESPPGYEAQVEQLEKLDWIDNTEDVVIIGKYHRKFRYMLSCGLIIIDEIMYVTISPADLPLFYRAVNFLKEERSIIFISCSFHELSPPIPSYNCCLFISTAEIFSSLRLIPPDEKIVIEKGAAKTIEKQSKN